MTRVVHCKVEPYTIYIGRGPCPVTGKRGRWGNPFPLGNYRDLASRKVCMDAYLAWLCTTGSYLYNYIDELEGEQVLGCWCRPKEGFKGRLMCHGQILAAVVDGCLPEDVD